VILVLIILRMRRFLDILHSSVLHPFIVILVLMVLLQFSGQGAITFYTVQIFKVRQHMPCGWFIETIQYRIQSKNSST
jgi:hypothetical protein